jgi:hypothetical protein
MKNNRHKFLMTFDEEYKEKYRIYKKDFARYSTDLFESCSGIWINSLPGVLIISNISAAKTKSVLPYIQGISAWTALVLVCYLLLLIRAHYHLKP